MVNKDKVKGHKRTVSTQSFQKSQAWRYLSRKDNADNFEGRTVLVNGKGLPKVENGEDDVSDAAPDSSKQRKGGMKGGPNNKEGNDDELQVHFGDNTIKSSKYTVWTFIPR